jgi:ketosteroid isomerase-like protein
MADATTDAIRAVLERKAAALKERSAPKLLELLEAEFVYVTASGRRLRRDAYVENGTGPHGLRFQSQEIEGLDVADFGDIAIATMILHDRFESQGQAVAETYRSFCVFRRHGSAWLWAGGQTCVAGRAPSPP